MGQSAEHVAIIMDGNGRWAEARGEPRTFGHRAGIEPVRVTIRECSRLGVGALTLFAFSSENWRRPETEVSTLMAIFMDALDREVEELHALAISGQLDLALGGGDDADDRFGVRIKGVG